MITTLNDMPDSNIQPKLQTLDVTTVGIFEEPTPRQGTLTLSLRSFEPNIINSVSLSFIFK